VSNRSEISGHKPQNGQNIRTGKPAVKETLPTPAEVDKAFQDQDMDAIDKALYNEQGKLAPSQVDQISADLVVSEGDTGLKELAKTIDIAKLEAAEAAVNHRSGMSYTDLKAAYEEEKAKAEAAGELLNKARIIINNPFHRYGQFVDSVPLGEALGMKKVWQPKESR
jgi:alpha-L-fucosidase